MHSNVYKQIRTGVAMHEAYLEWRYNRTQSNYERYVQLLEEMKGYVPDPSAKF